MSGAGSWTHWGWPLAAGCVGAVFTGLGPLQWLRRRRAHQADWTVGMLLYSVAALMEAGFLLAGTLEKGRQIARARREE